MNSHYWHGRLTIKCLAYQPGLNSSRVALERDSQWPYSQIWNRSAPVQVVDNVGVFIFPHDEDFIDDQLFLGLLLQIHLFDCNLQ